MSDHKVYDTPILKKIGIQQNHIILVLNAPDVILQNLQSSNTPFEAIVQSHKRYDLVWLFTNKIEELESSLNNYRQRIVANGMIWISWHKKASKQPSELNEDIIRATALALDLVDVKVASVDDTWSALKLVIPLKSR